MLKCVLKLLIIILKIGQNGRWRLLFICKFAPLNHT